MPKNDRKTAVIGVPVTPAQKAKFRRVAEKQGYTLASWMRLIAQREAERQGRAAR